MSQTSQEKTFEEQIEMFLKKNFPQIQMHGGSSSILKADEEAGEVRIALGGACSGCGISPMTVEAIKKRMTSDIDAVDRVAVEIGSGGGSVASYGAGEEYEEPTNDFDAPF